VVVSEAEEASKEVVVEVVDLEEEIEVVVASEEEVDIDESNKFYGI
jgi:hypothetical protein